MRQSRRYLAFFWKSQRRQDERCISHTMHRLELPL
jgi:hypothetical protein